MARIGRGFPSTPIARSRSRPVHAPIGLGVFATTSAFPAITVTSPSVTVGLSVFATTSAFPALTVDYDTQLGLGVFATTSTFPPIAASAPDLPGRLLTGDFQIEWAKQVLFGVAPYFVISVEGWDELPELDSGNAPRSARHGSWTGRDFAQERQVSAVIAISDDPANGFAVSRRDFRRLIGASEDGSEQELVIRANGETLKAKAKVSGRVLPAEHYGQGFTAASVRWTCSDPRRYDLQQQSVTVAPGGVNYCVNDGDISTNPLIRINGPVTNPAITNVTNSRTLRFIITLTSGQQLLVDTDKGTVTLAGADRMDALSDLSVPVEEWVLPAGTSLVSYSPSSGGDNLVELLFSSAYL
ncbi:hypothetical protein Sme01_02750 [Sphaerisporangium melleum]|uniref:Siphovirus-type tail component C-terminal domain-containing protein n=1 Tax=Sphaerisporangium melleum TaxID=321316 RepID=A0A917QNY9_9ACTN|nr:phage tail domain-containing protein [Sphaerisporangium melleum]GGK61119.1 hypothetical protein GCM10007964_00290 [Sphaerisporangium melleum]GII67799.1 hypothetical protein Sme01_02750 [Sphaerisporangium melleum]